MKNLSQKIAFSLLTGILLFAGVLFSCNQNKNASGTDTKSMSVQKSAGTEQMQTLTDDAGQHLSVPVKPKAILAGHDAVIALPLYELGLPVVASTMRKDPETGESTLFGLTEIYGVTTDQAGITNASGDGGYDLNSEVARKLQVDLIIASEGTEKMAAKFAKIAPYFVQKSYSAGVVGNSNQKVLAERFGAMDKWNELNNKHQQRLEEVRSKLPVDPGTQTFIGVITFDKVNIGNTIGGVMQVMLDLGFKRADWLENNPKAGFMLPIAPEEIKKLDQDIVFMMAGYSFPDRSKEFTRELVSKYAPGWDKFLDAAKEDRIIYLDSMYAVTPTFASNMYVLDELEKHFAKK